MSRTSRLVQNPLVTRKPHPAPRRFLHDRPSSKRTSHAALQALRSDDPTPKTIRIQGLIRSIRKQKRVAFAHVGDGTSYSSIQAVLTPDQATRITTGTYVDLTGRWQKSPGGGQSHELVVEAINATGLANAEDNPIQKKAQAEDTLRRIPHLRIRTKHQNLVARTRAWLMRSTAEYFENVGGEPVVQVQPPLITSSDCEGAGEVFSMAPQSHIHEAISNASKTPKVDQPPRQDGGLEEFFGGPKYLTVSSQLHLEAYAAELGDVWALSPTFRAEESDTSRHLAEFYMLEAEYRGVSELNTVIDHAEQLIRHVAQQLVKSRLAEEHIEHHAYRMENDRDPLLPADRATPMERWERLLAPAPWQRITYSAAIDALQSTANPPSWHSGLSHDHERWLVEHIAKNKPLVITHYPAAQKPFYMLPSSQDQQTTASQPGRTVQNFDILLPFGAAEVCGGSLREHDLESLIAAMRAKGLLTQKRESAAQQLEDRYPFLRENESLGSLRWYADLRRFGSSPHGGFGIGWDRLLAYLCGVNNVRDVVGFPRAWGLADC
jgi:asparaginyl-tRNA synthetase